MIFKIHYLVGDKIKSSFLLAEASNIPEMFFFRNRGQKLLKDRKDHHKEDDKEWERITWGKRPGTILPTLKDLKMLSHEVGRDWYQSIHFDKLFFT
jgi:hypothetical protein